MKKSITGTVALLAGAFIACSQGTVSFADLYSSGNYVTVEYDGQPVGGTTAHTGTYNDIHSGSDWTVQLYGFAGANLPLSALLPAFLDGTARPVSATLAGGGEGVYLGQWLSTAVGDIPGTTGQNQPATVAIAAWYNNDGTITSLKASETTSYAYGWSATGNVITGGLSTMSGHPPLFPASLPQLGNGIINITGFFGTIPEPSTIVLSLMGASAFLTRSGRKL